MIKIFLEGWLHAKNLNALQKYKNIQLTPDITECDVIYCPDKVNNNINISYPNKIYVYGPHFSVLPDQKFINYLNIWKKNHIYTMPSQWVIDIWQEILNKDMSNKMAVLPFGVETDKFFELKPLIERNNVIIYYKRRHPDELFFLETFLRNKNINYLLFNYEVRYDENDYLNYLQTCKYGIFLDSCESQGFAVEEALSCNVPLLIWEASNLNQEYGINYPSYKGTTIPYWNECCGEYFYEKEQLEEYYNKFISNLENYKPREYILNTLSMDKCEEYLIDLIDQIKKRD